MSITPPDFSALGRGDSGGGKLSDYRMAMRPNNARVTMRLAASDPCQEVLRDAQARAGREQLEAFVARRTAEEERTDAPIAVRLFIDSRMTPIVGWVPRGLEAPVIDTLSRLEDTGRSPRIPAAIVTTRRGLRVDLLLGKTR